MDDPRATLAPGLGLERASMSALSSLLTRTFWMITHNTWYQVLGIPHLQGFSLVEGPISSVRSNCVRLLSGIYSANPLVDLRKLHSKHNQQTA